MAVIAYTPTIADLPVGGVWLLGVVVTDPGGLAVDVAPDVTITLPDGTTASPVPELVTTGAHLARYVTVQAGRHIATVDAATDGTAAFAAHTNPVVAASGMPDLDETRAYLRYDVDDTSRDSEIQNALNAEQAAQRAVCRVPAAYPADLREALLRRVARNLALRGLPLAVLQGDGEAGDTILPGRDPEVKRLEAPHRRMFTA